MRLWTVHPRYLDTKGLVACWREALLAQKVLAGETRGYRNHPQLLRFRTAANPMSAIAAYLHAVAAEGTRRGYRFDVSKILLPPERTKMRETRGQLECEWAHLQRKLSARAPLFARRCDALEQPEAHPLFRIVPGDVRAWEKTNRPPA